jgi:arginine decarboxylase
MYKGVHRIKKRMSGLDSLNIGGGFPSKKFAFEYDYQYMIDEIINQIKTCDEAEVDVLSLLNLVLLL